MSWFSKIFGARTRRVAGSSLEPYHLLAAADVFCDHISALTGQQLRVHQVANTNSMIPTLDNNCVLLVESCPFADLAEGDIVLWRGNPSVWQRSGLLICHRLNERSKSGWFSLGDGNARQDPEPVTPANFAGRVVGTLYGIRQPDTDA